MLAVRLIVFPAQTGELLPAVGVVGAVHCSLQSRSPPTGDKSGKSPGTVAVLSGPPLLVVPIPSVSNASSRPSLSESFPEGRVLAIPLPFVSQPSIESVMPSPSVSKSI